MILLVLMCTVRQFVNVCVSRNISDLGKMAVVM